ncbi:putative cytochrome P450 monooxygenase [Massarina eburnea CBS 473.64]|uniref:Putative cytochrome P450 monooxygenase n=1 Tax=Massarina eburnea CBS 473.64 TaxID=1395130 RepID=A0A6A6RYC7_9PLEO|nr:putative cytochrome P450 monooxygenase [Massarina eburnea CBS 473.64]
MTLYQVALTGSVLTLAYIASYVFYNVFLHPLRAYPGPLLGRASILYMQKQTFDGALVRWLHSLHEEYGPVVRYAPNELSFIDADLVREVYSHRGSAFEKQRDFYGPDAFGSPPGLIRADQAAHSRQRKLVSHAFSDKALREQEQLLKGYAGLLAQKLQEKAAAAVPIDMVRWFNFTTFDIMSDLTFGEPLHLLEESEYTPWVKSIFGNIKMVAFTSILRRWRLLDALFQRVIPKNIRDQRKSHMEHSSMRVEKRLARQTDRPDIMTYVLRYSGGKDEMEKSLLPTELNSNSGLFMLAGTETTATLLSGMTYHLLRNPEKMERLKKEIRTAFGSFDDVHIGELSQLEYLHACIEEGLRMYPPVPLGLPRTTPRGGAMVNGKWLPGGTVISLQQYAAYHSEYNFKNAESFVPERWMPEGQAEYGSDKRDVFIPFSNGPRNCLGKNLAYHEMRLLCVSVLLHFDLELADDKIWTDQNVYVLWEKNPLMVKLTSVKTL